MKTKTFNTRYMVELALMIAIIILMAYTPLGYLQTGGLTITFLTVPVAVGAIILGPAGGAICGLCFGLTSFMKSIEGSGGALSSALMAVNPLGMTFVCLVPRILEGWLCALIFKSLKGKLKNTSYFIASLSCPILNTLFFMSALVAIFYHTDYVQGLVETLGAANPVMFVVLLVGVQGAIEAVVCFVLASAISRALALALKNA